MLNGKEKIASEPIIAENYEQASAGFLRWWENRARQDQLPSLTSVDAIALRVVHGARDFVKPVLIDARVIKKNRATRETGALAQ